MAGHDLTLDPHDPASTVGQMFLSRTKQFPGAQTAAAPLCKLEAVFVGQLSCGDDVIDRLRKDLRAGVRSLITGRRQARRIIEEMEGCKTFLLFVTADGLLVVYDNDRHRLRKRWELIRAFIDAAHDTGETLLGFITEEPSALLDAA
jgi:hypothetical protein